MTPHRKLRPPALQACISCRRPFRRWTSRLSAAPASPTIYRATGPWTPGPCRVWIGTRRPDERDLHFCRMSLVSLSSNWGWRIDWRRVPVFQVLYWGAWARSLRRRRRGAAAATADGRGASPGTSRRRKAAAAPARAAAALGPGPPPPGDGSERDAAGAWRARGATCSLTTRPSTGRWRVVGGRCARRFISW